MEQKTSAIARDTPVNGIADGAPRLISSQFSFTEGPAVDSNGNVFFTDQPNDRIWEYHTDGTLSIFMDHAGRSNGMYFDEDGNLVSCADEHNQLWRIAPDRKVTVLVARFKGKLLNGPNDVWVNRQTGDIYFTDPYYERSYWPPEQTHELRQNVYLLRKGAPEPVLVEDQLVKPNGIIGTPDGKTLYIADIEGNRVYKYDIAPDGSLLNRKKFIDHGSDGITLDQEGNLYITGKGVSVFSPGGTLIQHFDFPGQQTANLCFCGKEMDNLFIAAGKSVYVLKTKVKGIR